MSASVDCCEAFNLFVHIFSLYCLWCADSKMDNLKVYLTWVDLSWWKWHD